MQQTINLNLKQPAISNLTYLESNEAIETNSQPHFSYHTDNTFQIVPLFSEDSFTPTSLVPTASTFFVSKARKYLAIAAQNSQLEAFLIIYDYETKQVLTQFQIQQPTKHIKMFKENHILVVQKDYIYCYQITHSRTQDPCKEIFWTMAADEILHIEVFDDKYVCFCQDMYIRLYQNENLIDEGRTFPRNPIQYIGSYIDLLYIGLQNGKFKIYNIQQDGFKSVCIIDDINQIGEKFVQNVFMLNKPYSMPLAQYLQDAEIFPHHQKYIEQQQDISCPLPFICLIYKDSSYGIAMLDLVKDDKMNLKLVPTLLYQSESLAKNSVITLSSDYMLCNDLFITFMKQYKTTFLDGGELPFIVDTVMNTCKQIVLIISNQSQLILLEHPIILSMQDYLDDYADRGGPLTQVIKRRAKKEEKISPDDNVIDATGLSKKKVKKQKKSKKVNEQTQEEIELIELFRLRAEVAQIMIDEQYKQNNISENDFSQITQEVQQNIEITPTGDGFKIQCKVDGVELTGGVLQIDNIRYNAITSNNTYSFQSNDIGLGQILTAIDLNNVTKDEFTSSNYQQFTLSQKQLFHSKQRNLLFKNLPYITTQSMHEMIVTYNYKKHHLNIKAEIETSILPYMRIKEIDTSSPKIQNSQHISKAVFSNITIENLQQLFQICSIDPTFKIKNPTYKNPVDLLNDVKNPNIFITSEVFIDLLQHISNTEAMKLYADAGITQDYFKFYIEFSRQNNQFIFSTLNFKALLIICQVIMRAMKTPAPMFTIGSFYEKIISGTVEQVQKTKLLQQQLQSASGEISQALVFASNEVVEKCLQKDLNGVFAGYDTIAVRSLQQIGQKNQNFDLLKSIIASLQENEALAAFFDKDLAGKFQIK